MKKNLIISLISIVIVILIAGAFYLVYEKKNKIAQNNASQPTKTTTPTETQVYTGTGNIHVFKPASGDTVGLPLKILGEARVFENQFMVRIKDKNGNIVKEESVMAEAGDAGQFNLFSKDINYNKPNTSEGTIEFFDYSAKDGSEIDKVIIPVKFDSVFNYLNVQVFFGNKEKDPQTLDCKTVYPVMRRIGYTKESAKAAMIELLSGPTAEEMAKGVFTSINEGVKLNKITIIDGVATVDFSEALQSGVGGSCRVASISAQITETLKQFGTVKSVVISIDGKTGDVLQP